MTIAKKNQENAEAAIKTLAWCTPGVEKVAFFLQEMNGSVIESWSGKLSANSQRALFGKVYGKGEISIDGLNGLIYHTTKIAFGNNTESQAFTYASL